MDNDQYLLLTAALREIGHCTIRVHGKSMVPFICPGDRVRIVAGLLEPLKGRCIAFSNGSQVIIHRIRAIDNKKNLVVVGDSSPRSDSVIQTDEVLGTVTMVEHHGRSSLIWCKPPLQYAALSIGRMLRCVFGLLAIAGPKH